MPDALKYVIDAIAAAALFLALLMVFVVDWAFFSKGPGKDTLPNVTVIGGGKGEQKKLKLAVTKTGEFTDGPKVEKWDDMGKLLSEMGQRYRDFDNLSLEELLRRHEKKTLNEYDVIFLTCSPAREEDQLKIPLQSYVANGGILYASDWRYDTIATAFPEMVQENARGEGTNQTVDAEVVDKALREILGPKIELKFDLSEWKTAAFGGPRVETLLKGKYRKHKSTESATAPLMVKFRFKKGTVIFTSFHNEKQNSRTEKQLLQYLVFSLETANIDADVNSTMNEQGFKPQRSNLLSNAERPSITQEYKNEQTCTLRFTLGFRGDGAKLRFNIKSPDGLQFTKDCESTVGFEVSNAAKGIWTYTVTAPDNYATTPFTVTVGEKK
jgi:hypothetical protein